MGDEQAQRDPLLLWVDLETTGLRPTDCVLEAAFVLTGHDLTELWRWDTLVRPPAHVVSWLLDDGAVLIDPAVVRMHRESGLIDDLMDSADELPSLQEVEHRLCTELACRAEGRLVHPAGLGVNFDVSVLAAQCPVLHGMLHYRQFNVSAMLMLIDSAAPGAVQRVEPTRPHRAMPDVEAGIAVARRLCGLVSGVAAGPA